MEKSAHPQALERIPRFGEEKPDHSAPAPSRFLAKSPQILGNFQAHPGLRACLRKGRWRRKGNWKSESLWSLRSNIFNTFLAAEPFQDNADLALGGMVLAHGTANIADQFFGWIPRGQASGFLARLHSPGGYDGPEILRYLNRQFGLMGC